MAEVERASPAVVEEQAVGCGLAVAPDVEGDRLVDRVARRREAEGVGVPVDEGPAASVERPGLVAEREDVLVDRQRLAQREAAPVEAERLGRIGDDRLALRDR